MVRVERLPDVAPARNVRSKKLDAVRIEGVKKLKEYVLFRMIPTLPGFAPENFPHPEGSLDHADEFSSLFEIQRRQIIRKLIRPVKRRLGLPDYEPVWHKQVQNEMARWGKEDLGLSEKQLRQAMKLVDEQMNQAVKLQKDKTKKGRLVRIKTLFRTKNNAENRSPKKLTPVEKLAG